MKMFVLLTFISIGISSIQGCHTKVMAPGNGPKSKRSIHASFQDDMVEYFTGCMSAKAGKKTFENWRSVVSFVIKDMRWFSESDEIFCNSSLDQHTAACWSYNIDYLVKVSSTINQPSKDCIYDYDQRQKVKKTSDSAGRKKRSARNKKKLLNVLNPMDDRSMDDLMLKGDVDMKQISMQNFNRRTTPTTTHPSSTNAPRTTPTTTRPSSTNAPRTTPTTTRPPSTKAETKSCNKKEQEFKDCIVPSTTSGARTFTVTLKDEKREPTFDKSILDFISNHLSDCNASKPERMNQISVCNDGDSGARTLTIRPPTRVTSPPVTYNCLNYRKLHALLRNTSPKLERAKSCDSGITCRRLRVPMNGYIKDCVDSKRLSAGTSCTFGCKAGYKLKKDKHLSTTCNLNKNKTRANWSLKRAICELA